MYVFPGIGLGAILSKATTITQSMIYASAEALSTALLPSEIADGWLYPNISRIRDVSVIVARGVIRAAQDAGVDREVRLRGMADDEVDRWVRERMYDPHAETGKLEREVGDLVGEVKKAHVNGVNGVNGGWEGPRL